MTPQASTTAANTMPPVDEVLAPKSELLHEFATYWDLEVDRNERVVDMALSGTKVSQLLYEGKDEWARRQTMRRKMDKEGLIAGTDYNNVEIR